MKIEYGELKEFQEKLEQLSETEVEDFFVDTCNELGARHMRQAIQNTPVKSGELKRSWRVSTPVHKGGEYRVTVYNPQKYAIYVEYGHRQQVGRYVPAIGKKLKQGWVNGHFMLTKAEENLKPKIPSIVEKNLNEKLKDKLQ